MRKKTESKKSILVVGASSGFGRSCATNLAARGHQVYAASRSAGRSLDDLAENLVPIIMDVQDDASVALAIEKVIEQGKGIDVVVNSAGIGYAGSVEDMSMEEFHDQLETNFFGVVRVTKCVLPHMREQRKGLFINISSIGGCIGLPFQSAYSASKFALEGFTESLRHEVRPFGISALILQPGDFKTGITKNRLFSKGHHSGSVYFQAAKKAIDTTIVGEVNGLPPEVLASKICKLIESESSSIRYSCGPFMQRLAAKAKHWIPEVLFERLIANEFKQ